MPLNLVTAPAVEPISTAEAKLFLRQDSSDDDALIGSLITASRRAVENYLQRALVTQEWDLFVDRFCNVEIPLAPLQSITSISYIDDNGVSQTVTSSIYSVFSYTDQPGRVELAYGQSWPSHRIVSDAITIRFVAGYGVADDVPDDIKQGIYLTLAEYYENRELNMVGVSVSKIPDHIERMLFPYKVHGF